MTDYILGVDVSRHQGLVNWKMTKAAGARFVVARCTVGDYYVDPTFEYNYNETTAIGLPFTAYHVMCPEISAEKQAMLFIKTVGTKALSLPPVLDCELPRGQTKNTISINIENQLHLLNAQYDRVPMIYTNQNFWNNYVMRSIKWIMYPLLVANYTTAPQPAMPKDWLTWTGWQFSADGNNLGALFGAESASIDLDRMKPDFYKQYIDDEIPDDDDIPIPIVLPQYIYSTVKVGDVNYAGELERQQ